MKSKLVILAGSLIGLALLTPVVLSQEKKPGTTADTWREAFPSTVTTQPIEETVDNGASVRSTEDTKKTVLATQQSLMEAIKVRDADSLEQLIAGDFSFASTQLSRVINRTQYLKYALNDLKLTSFEIDKTTVTLFGRTAIITSELKQKSSLKDIDSSGSFLVTEVWVNQGGTWRIASRHESIAKDQ